MLVSVKFAVKNIKDSSHMIKSVEMIDKEDSVTCPECGKQLKKQYITEHLRLHSGDRPFKCRHCDKGFISFVSLRRHIIGHLGMNARKCEICGKEYKRLESYEMHMLKHKLEAADAPVKHDCGVCGQSFFLEMQLQTHLKRHREKKFKCNFPNCRADFVFRSELTYHIRSHTGYKPFLCDVCGYEGSNRTRLLRHLRTHTGERKYHCEYCTYKAGNSTHLRRHMRIHIGSKPYKCPYCSYTCNTHENIRKHIIKTKKHAGLFIYPCQVCGFGTNNAKEFKEHLMDNHKDMIADGNKAASSAYSGLYVKSSDPQKPPEGTQILPLKDKKTKPNKKSTVQSARKRKPKLKIKITKNRKSSFSKKIENKEQGLGNCNNHLKRNGSNSILEPHAELDNDRYPEDYWSDQACSVSESVVVVPTTADMAMFNGGFASIDSVSPSIPVSSHFINTGNIDELHNYCAPPLHYMASEKVVQRDGKVGAESDDDSSSESMLVMDL